jgi:hypothetical protein
MKLSKLPLPIKIVLFVLVSIVAIVIDTIRVIDKAFIKLPKIARIIFVYSLIGLVVYSFVNPQTIVKTETIKEETIVVVDSETIEEQPIEETTKTIDLGNENATNIYTKAIELGLNQNQALLVVSISRHETGNWTSKAFKNNNNFGGIMTNNATQIKNYETYENGLTDFVSILKKYYFDLGLNTIEQIGSKYCPVGAKNDPNGLNKYWVNGVKSFYNSYIAAMQ